VGELEVLFRLYLIQIFWYEVCCSVKNKYTVRKANKNRTWYQTVVDFILLWFYTASLGDGFSLLSWNDSKKIIE